MTYKKILSSLKEKYNLVLNYSKNTKYIDEYKYVLYLLDEIIINCENHKYFDLKSIDDYLRYGKVKDYAWDMLIGDFKDIQVNVDIYYSMLVRDFIKEKTDESDEWRKYYGAFYPKLLNHTNFFVEFVSYILNNESFDDLELIKVFDKNIIEVMQETKHSLPLAYIVMMEAYESLQRNGLVS